MPVFCVSIPFSVGRVLIVIVNTHIIIRRSHESTPAAANENITPRYMIMYANLIMSFAAHAFATTWIGIGEGITVTHVCFENCVVVQRSIEKIRYVANLGNPIASHRNQLTYIKKTST